MLHGKNARQDDTNNQPQFTQQFFSSLLDVINSGRFWRCIRWNDEGSTVLITSPLLFEREILRNAEKKLQFNMSDFASFVDLLMQLGFEKVLNQRPLKVQKFRHPCFKRESGKLQKTAVKRGDLQRERKMLDEEDRQDKSTSANKKKALKRNLEQKVKRKGELDLCDDSARTAGKRKRSGEKSSEISVPVKKRKSAERDLASVLRNHDTPTQQMCRIYSAEEISAAKTLFSLSAPVIFANYTAVELMVAQSLVDVSRSFVVSQLRSIQELKATDALLDLANSVCVKKD